MKAALPPQIVPLRFPARGAGECSASMPALSRFSANIVIRMRSRQIKAGIVLERPAARNVQIVCKKRAQRVQYTRWHIDSGTVLACSAESPSKPLDFPGVVPQLSKNKLPLYTSTCTALVP